MVCVPTVRLEVDKLADAPGLKATVPRTFVPSRNVTVPVGMLQLPGTWAAKVTEVAPTEGLLEEVTTVAGWGWTSYTPMSIVPQTVRALLSRSIAGIRGALISPAATTGEVREV